MAAKCEYCRYCSFYSKDSRGNVCDSCRMIVYPAGSMLLYEDMIRNPMVLLAGIVSSFNVANTIFEDSDEANVMRFIHVRGSFLNNDVLWDDEIRPGFEQSGQTCMTECVFARISKAAARLAFRNDPAIARSVAQSLTSSWMNAALLSSALRQHGVYEGTRDLLLFLADKDVALTHQQIALISNHSRASVTKAIGRLRAKEPRVWHRVSHVVKRG